MQLQNPLKAICPALEADVLMALSVGGARTPGSLVRSGDVDASVSGVRRCLERLERNGIVIPRASGNRIEYSLNHHHMLAELVRRAGSAQDQFIEFLARRISTWDAKPMQVTLYGSAARGDMDADSDIDLMFIIPDDSNEDLYTSISDLAVDAYRLTGNDVRPMVVEVAEVSDVPVFRSILREGIPVHGDSAWLSRRLELSAAA